MRSVERNLPSDAASGDGVEVARDCVTTPPLLDPTNWYGCAGACHGCQARRTACRDLREGKLRKLQTVPQRCAPPTATRSSVKSSQYHANGLVFYRTIDYNNTHLPARSDPAATHYNVNVKSWCSSNINNMSWIRRFGPICASAGRPRDSKGRVEVAKLHRPLFSVSVLLRHSW